MDKTYERITIKDIAERRGVTANTVSRALRNDTKLSEATLKKVHRRHRKWDIYGFFQSVIPVCLRLTIR